MKHLGNWLGYTIAIWSPLPASLPPHLQPRVRRGQVRARCRQFAGCLLVLAFSGVLVALVACLLQRG